MSKEYRSSCVNPSVRFSNDELVTLMRDVVSRTKGSSRQLFLTIAPLLVAFFGGQVQAGRASVEDLGQLVQQALVAAYRFRSSYDFRQPFRAWLLNIALSEMANYQYGPRVLATGKSMMKSKLECLVDVLSIEQIHVIRDELLAERSDTESQMWTPEEFERQPRMYRGLARARSSVESS